MIASNFPGGIYLVDFEFHPAACREGNPPMPVCMVVRQWPSGDTQRYWQAGLQALRAAPFPTGSDALFVAYYASAEMDCFAALGWDYPANLLDLFAEFRWLTNGLRPAHGNGLLGALLYFNLPTIGGEAKDAMRDLVLAGGPWPEAQQAQILDYCESDVVGLAHLLTAMHSKIDLPRALLRGRYMQSVSKMQMTGIPLDVQTMNLLAINWHAIQDELIVEVDQDYGAYAGRTFKAEQWERI